MVEWGWAEIACKDQISYVSREKYPMNGAALKEEIGDGILKENQARKLKAMRHGRSQFHAILGSK